MDDVNQPIRLGVMFSGGASSLKHLYENDLNYGKSYQVVAAFSSSRQASGIAYAESIGIKPMILDYHYWCKLHGKKKTDLVARKTYHTIILRYMRGMRVDAIILSGYMLLITDPLFSAYEGRMLNVHPALLSLLDEAGERRFTGLDVVKRAMDAGLPTGSTVHEVTKEADMGRIITEVELPYLSGDDHVLHQEKMKLACDGPAYVQALAKLIPLGWPRNFIAL